MTLWDPAGGGTVLAPLDWRRYAQTVWVDDALPTGSTPSGESWVWVSANPNPVRGTKAHQSPVTAGEHQHLFTGATATLAVGVGDVLFCYVYLDPANPPRMVMLKWNDGASFEHRAYWGENLSTNGTNGTNSRRFMGPLPPAGQWVRLETPAFAVGLEGTTVSGMAFDLYDGGATWDSAGVRKGSESPEASAALARQLFVPGAEQGATLSRSIGEQTPAVPGQAGLGLGRQYHQDALGTAERVSGRGAGGAGGASSSDYVTDAWGNLLVNAGSAVSGGSGGSGGVGLSDNPFVFGGGLGYWQEPDLGLTYVRARWLDTTTGQWLSVDPVEGEPRYSYVRNRPTISTDPSGTNPPKTVGQNLYDLWWNNPVGPWIDKHLLNGGASHFGQVWGEYETGQTSLGNLLLTGLWESGKLVVLAVSIETVGAAVITGATGAAATGAAAKASALTIEREVAKGVVEETAKVAAREAAKAAARQSLAHYAQGAVANVLVAAPITLAISVVSGKSVDWGSEAISELIDGALQTSLISRGSALLKALMSVKVRSGQVGQRLLTQNMGLNRKLMQGAEAFAKTKAGRKLGYFSGEATDLSFHSEKAFDPDKVVEEAQHRQWATLTKVLSKNAVEIGGRYSIRFKAQPFNEILVGPLKGWKYLPAKIFIQPVRGKGIPLPDEGAIMKALVRLTGVDTKALGTASSIPAELAEKYEPAYTLNVLSWIWKGPQGQFIYQEGGLLKDIQSASELAFSLSLRPSAQLIQADINYYRKR